MDFLHTLPALTTSAYDRRKTAARRRQRSELNGSYLPRGVSDNRRSPRTDQSSSAIVRRPRRGPTPFINQPTRRQIRIAGDLASLSSPAKFSPSQTRSLPTQISDGRSAALAFRMRCVERVCAITRAYRAPRNDAVGLSNARTRSRCSTVGKRRP